MNSEPMLLSHEISALVHHVELNRTGWWDEALSGIVLASVWSLDRPVNAEEIVSELRKSFRLPVGKEQLSLVIRKLIENDSIIDVGGRFKVSEQLRVTLDKDVETAKEVRTNARSYFESLVMDSPIDIDPTTMWEAFERVFLIPMMRDIGANTYQLLAGDGQVYDQSHIDSSYLHSMTSVPLSSKR